MTMTRMLDDLSPIQRASLLKTKKVSSGATSLWMIDRKSSQDITSPKYFRRQSNESRSTWYLMILDKKMPTQNLTLLIISKSVQKKPFHPLQQRSISKRSRSIRSNKVQYPKVSKRSRSIRSNKVQYPKVSKRSRSISSNKGLISNKRSRSISFNKVQYSKEVKFGFPTRT